MRTSTLPFLILSAPLAAQTFTAADAVPLDGVYSFSRHFADASTWTDVDTLGTGLTWDMSGLDWQAAAPFTLTAMPADECEFTALAPDATTCLLEEVPGDIDMHWFYRNASDMLEALGIVSVIPGITPDLEGSCPRLLLNYPTSLGDVFPSSLIGCDMDVDAVERKVLGTGTLVTPYGNVADMVLIRTTICGVDPFGKGEIICTHRYECFAPGNLLRPRLTVFMENAQWISAYLEVLTGFMSAGEQHYRDPRISLSPNPAKDQVVISLMNGLSLGEVTVHASDGRSVLSIARSQGDRLLLDVMDLAPGHYTVRLAVDGRVHALRFVKE